MGRYLLLSFLAFSKYSSHFSLSSPAISESSTERDFTSDSKILLETVLESKKTSNLVVDVANRLPSSEKIFPLTGLITKLFKDFSCAIFLYLSPSTNCK